MNACVDCKHHHKDRISQHWCIHPDNDVDLVRGGTQQRLCTFARSKIFGSCGPTGDLFEAAPPVGPPASPPVEPEAYWVPPTLWQRIKAFFVGVGPW